MLGLLGYRDSALRNDVMANSEERTVNPKEHASFRPLYAAIGAVVVLWVGNFGYSA